MQSQIQALTNSFDLLLLHQNMEKLIERQLPEELLMLVLARLPWQDTFRLRAVCKLWSCILRDPNFLKMCSPSCGVPLFLSSAFPESDLTIYYRPGAHRCTLEGRLCPDCDFQFFSPEGDQWSIFPKTWFHVFLHGGLATTCTRYVKMVAVKGGIFMLFFRRQHKAAGDAGSTPSPTVIVADPAATTTTTTMTTTTTSATERCGGTEHTDKSACPLKQKSEIIYLVNPFTQTHRRLNLPLHLKEKGSSLFWMRIKKMIENKQSNTFKILLGPRFEKCDKHECCDVWTLDYYDVIENSWSKFTFHLVREVTIGENEQVIDVGFVYDATIVGGSLCFLTCHSDSLFAVWQFNPDSGSIFPTRLADIPVLNVYKPSIYERQGRLVLLGQSFDMGQFDFSIRLWEYVPSDLKWISVMSFMGDLTKACWNLKGDFGQDFACVSVELTRKSEYYACDLVAGTCQKLPSTSAGRKIFMLEPRLDLQL